MAMAAPASAEEPTGTYSVARTVVHNGKTDHGKWSFTPCGEGCVNRSDGMEMHLQGDTWRANFGENCWESIDATTLASGDGGCDGHVVVTYQLTKTG
ncbi:hypothetical protein AWC16_14750 [Mycolicibacter longobardus]|uniref:Uncharacterized protein n=1 Tax=Mycolicibacter longobardus TaxID=1108812 RepID=A0A1X1YG58_9MYCO|nr:hypothetical protein AWC16_14750 [Mycolicibacter longobardus]